MSEIEKRPLSSDTYLCILCGQHFSYELDEGQLKRLLTKLNPAMPFRVSCGNCGELVPIYGGGASPKPAKRTKRMDWDVPSMGKKPWEDVPRGQK
jgi:hypothetical protein